MRYILFSLLLPFSVVSAPRTALSAEYQSPSALNQNLTSKPTDEKFYTEAGRLVQQQINLIARIEQALIEPDANRMRACGRAINISSQDSRRFSSPSAQKL